MARLDCKICLKVYKSNRAKSTPRILTNCGHTLCEACAETLLAQHVGEIICPYDRKITIIDGGVEQLHKNYAILAYIDELQEEGNVSDDEEEPEQEPGQRENAVRNLNEDHAHYNNQLINENIQDLLMAQQLQFEDYDNNSEGSFEPDNDQDYDDFHPENFDDIVDAFGDFGIGDDGLYDENYDDQNYW